MNEIDRKLSKDYVISNARLPTNFGSLRELYEGLSVEVREAIEFEISEREVGCSLEGIVTYLSVELPKVKNPDDVEKAYVSFVLTGQKHREIKASMDSVMDEMPLTADTKHIFVNAMYAISLGKIFTGKYNSIAIRGRTKMNEIETIIREAKLPTRFNSFKELYEGFSHEVREALDLEFGRKKIKGNVDRMGRYLMEMLSKIEDWGRVDRAYESFSVLARSNQTLQTCMAGVTAVIPVSPKTKPKVVNKMYVVALSIIYDGIYNNKGIVDGERIIG